MYQILVRAGTRPAGSKVTIDGIGEVTVGHWQAVSADQAEMFRLSHPSGKHPTLIQAFAKDPNVQVRADKPQDSNNNKQDENKKEGDG